MKIILLFISLFLSTSVFAGEPKEHGAGVKDEWHKDKMVGTKNDNNIVRDSRAPIILDTVPPPPNKPTPNKESSMHQGAMNSVRPVKPESKINTGQPVEKPACSLHDSIHC